MRDIDPAAHEMSSGPECIKHIPDRRSRTAKSSGVLVLKPLCSVGAFEIET